MSDKNDQLYNLAQKFIKDNENNSDKEICDNFNKFLDELKQIYYGNPQKDLLICASSYLIAEEFECIRRKMDPTNDNNDSPPPPTMYM